MLDQRAQAAAVANNPGLLAVRTAANKSCYKISIQWENHYGWMGNVFELIVSS